MNGSSGKVVDTVNKKFRIEFTVEEVFQEGPRGEGYGCTTEGRDHGHLVTCTEENPIDDGRNMFYNPQENKHPSWGC